METRRFLWPSWSSSWNDAGLVGQDVQLVAGDLDIVVRFLAIHPHQVRVTVEFHQGAALEDDEEIAAGKEDRLAEVVALLGEFLGQVGQRARDFVGPAVLLVAFHVHQDRHGRMT